MNILVVGSGGREHALCWKIKQSDLVDKLYCAPGNAGISNIAECLDINVDDLEGLLNFAREKEIDLTVVGPELPLTLGITDLFEKENLKIFGPDMAASELEGSKVYSKSLMERYGIPTARFKSFSEIESAKEWIKELDTPFVVKADGLAAGKGVIICRTVEEGESAINTIMSDKTFGNAGLNIVIEEFLSGEEASIFVLTDGDDYIILEPSQDHKPIYDNDTGPNTGGMGAYCPAPIVSEALLKDVETGIIKPTLEGLKNEGRKYRGVLYIGLMINKGEAKVLEYNCRFGDPEAQPLLMKMKTDIVPLLFDIAKGKIENREIIWKEGFSVCVVMSSIGYPGKYDKGVELSTLDRLPDAPDIVLFHAGTKMEGDRVVTNGGRVLGLTVRDDTIEKAIEKVYENISKIDDGSLYYRTDIGKKALK